MKMIELEKDIESILITEEEIKQKVEELGKRISADYRGKSVLMVCILKGSVVFFSDLVRNIDCNVNFDFMVASSYGNSTETTNTLNVRLDSSQDITGKDVILVEDIIDSGNTLSKLKKMLSERNPASLRIVTLLDKPERRNPDIDISVDYSGFSIPDEFVVGYGLDYAEKYRNIPYIGILKRSVYEK